MGINPVFQGNMWYLLQKIISREGAKHAKGKTGDGRKLD
jgi:hypothetical protein